MLTISCGEAPEGGAIGFGYWHSPGAMSIHFGTGVHDVFLAFWKSSYRATFAYNDSKMVVLAAGETGNGKEELFEGYETCVLANLAILR